MALQQIGSKLVGTGYSLGSFSGTGQGTSVSLSSDGKILAVGNPQDAADDTGFGVGATWIFVKNDQNLFIQQGTKLIGTGTSGSSSQGYSVSLAADGNTLAIGAPSDNNDGATWIFTQSGGTWSQLGTKLIGTGASGR